MLQRNSLLTTVLVAGVLLTPSVQAQTATTAKYKGKTLSQWLAQLSSEKHEERDSAFTAIKEFGPKGQAAAVPILKEMLTDLSPEFRAFSAYTLRKLGPVAEAALPDLIAAIKDDTASVQIAAILSLHKFGPDAVDAVPNLIGLLGKGNNTGQAHGVVGEPEPEMYAIELLGTFGPKAVSALPALKKAFDSATPASRAPASRRNSAPSSRPTCRSSRRAS
jgi:HEAT repeat protein